MKQNKLKQIVFRIAVMLTCVSLVLAVVGGLFFAANCFYIG